MVEQLPCKHQVESSIPSAGTNFFQYNHPISLGAVVCSGDIICSHASPSVLCSSFLCPFWDFPESRVALIWTFWLIDKINFQRDWIIFELEWDLLSVWQPLYKCTASPDDKWYPDPNNTCWVEIFSDWQIFFMSTINGHYRKLVWHAESEARIFAATAFLGVRNFSVSGTQ